MSDPVRVPPSGGPGHWRRWLLPVLASAAWLVLTFCLYRHAVQGEQAHLLELCHTRLAATAHQLMDARDWNAGHGGVYVPLSAYGEPNPWLPEKDRTLQTADGRTLVLMNPAYMSRQMAERLTEPGFRLAIVGQAPLRPGNRADDWERRILATATQGGQVFFSGEDCLPQGRLRLLRTLAAQESCLRCHQGHKEGDMLGGISISMDAAAYVRDLERKQRELGVRALLDKPVPPAMLLAALRDVPRGCPGDGQAGPTPCGAEAEAPVIWDRAAALAAADQDEELLHTLVTALRDDLPRLEATLEAGRKLAADPAVPAARTAEALRRAAHALKNSAATLCFEELRLRAAALEQAARQVLAGTPENAAGLGSLAAACAGALARAEEALRRDNG